MARLIGAPPGYVGYEEGGLPDRGGAPQAVQRDPARRGRKAHPDVFNVLQVLDDGRLATDGQGHGGLRNTVIVMTSNLGGQHIQSMAGKPHEVIKEVVWDELKHTFRPRVPEPYR